MKEAAKKALSDLKAFLQNLEGNNLFNYCLKSMLYVLVFAVAYAAQDTSFDSLYGWGYVIGALFLLKDLRESTVANKKGRALVKAVFWEVRVGLTIMFVSSALDIVYVMPLEYAKILVDEQVVTVIGAMLAPLFAWVVVITKKDIEINKLREAWCYNLRGYISDYIVSADSLVRYYGESGDEMIGDGKLLLKSKKKDDLVAEIEASRNLKEVKEKGRDATNKMLGLATKIEISLNWDQEKAEGVLKRKVRGLKRSALRYCSYMVSRKEAEYRCGGAVRFKNSYEEEIRDKYEDAYTKLHFDANVYFMNEWRRIKVFDKDSKRTIIMLIVLMGGLVLAYFTLFIRVNIEQAFSIWV